MAYQPDGTKALYGKGSLWWDRLNATTGASDGLRFLGSADVADIGVTPETVDLNDGTAPGGGLLARVERKRTVEKSITLRQFDDENVALGLMGDISALSQTGSTVTAEAFATGAKGDRAYRTVKRNISLITVKVAGGATLTVNTDYIVVNAKAGLIYIVKGGGGDGHDLTVDYTYATLALNKISIGTATTVKGKLLFVPNNANGPQDEIYIPSAQLSPDGPLGFLADEFGAIKLKLAVLYDGVNNPTAPYGYVQPQT